MAMRTSLAAASLVLTSLLLSGAVAHATRPANVAPEDSRVVKNVRSNLYWLQRRNPHMSKELADVGRGWVTRDDVENADAFAEKLAEKYSRLKTVKRSRFLSKRWWAESKVLDRAATQKSAAVGLAKAVLGLQVSQDLRKLTDEGIQAGWLDEKGKDYQEQANIRYLVGIARSGYAQPAEAYFFGKSQLDVWVEAAHAAHDALAGQRQREKRAFGQLTRQLENANISTSIEDLGRLKNEVAAWNAKDGVEKIESTPEQLTKLTQFNRGWAEKMAPYQAKVDFAIRFREAMYGVRPY
jgi:hypothetical protein